MSPPTALADDDDDRGPLAYNEETGEARDPIAFRDAIIADPEKLAAIEADKELADALLGDDTAKIQATLMRLFDLTKKREDRENTQMLNSPDLLRSGCTVPRDPTALYKQMRKVGLEYGPRFRLLTQVWIPEETARLQRAAAEERGDI